jgi:hypothetical protein
LDESSLNSNENLKEKEKLVYICSCATKCVKNGGSVGGNDNITRSFSYGGILSCFDMFCMITKMKKTMMEIRNVFCGFVN